MEAHSFMPKINNHSRSLAMSKHRSIYNTEANLLKYQQKKMEKLQKKREQKQKEEVGKYRFHPTLMPSKKLYEQYMKPADKVHERLFRKACSKAKGRTSKGTPAEHSFSPNLKETSSMSKLERPSSKKELVDSLYKWKDELEMKIEEKRKTQLLNEISFDQKTGQRLFKPITNTLNESGSHKKNCPVDVYTRL